MIKRYDFIIDEFRSRMESQPRGDWVRYDDHEKAMSDSHLNTECPILDLAKICKDMNALGWLSPEQVKEKLNNASKRIKLVSVDDILKDVFGQEAIRPPSLTSSNAKDENGGVDGKIAVRNSALPKGEGENTVAPPTSLCKNCGHTELKHFGTPNKLGTCVMCFNLNKKCVKFVAVEEAKK